MNVLYRYHTGWSTRTRCCQSQNNNIADLNNALHNVKYSKNSVVGRFRKPLSKTNVLLFEKENKQTKERNNHICSVCSVSKRYCITHTYTTTTTTNTFTLITAPSPPPETERGKKAGERERGGGNEQTNEQMILKVIGQYCKK